MVTFDGGTRVGENGVVVVDGNIVVVVAVGSVVTGDTVVVMFSNNVTAIVMRFDDRIDDVALPSDDRIDDVALPSDDRIDDVALPSDDGLLVDMISIDLNNTNPIDTCLSFLSLQFSIKVSRNSYQITQWTSR